jgi:hypothetical protein
MFGGSEMRDSQFELGKLWKNQGIDEDLKIFLKSLMKKMYVLIEKYKFSTDISENTKKRELWEEIKKSKELKEFISSSNALTIIKSYTLNKVKVKKGKEVDFSRLNEIVSLYSKTKAYFTSLENILVRYNANTELQFQYSQKLYNFYVQELFVLKKLSEQGVKFFNDLFNNIRIKENSIFDQITVEPDLSIIMALDKIMTIYGNTLSDNKDIETVFRGHEQLAINKGVQYASSITEVGKALKNGDTPSFNNISLASKYFKN